MQFIIEGLPSSFKDFVSLSLDIFLKKKNKIKKTYF